MLRVAALLALAMGMTGCASNTDSDVAQGRGGSGASADAAVAAGSDAGPAVASCDDGVRNGAESDVDCGGTCGGCEDGQSCNAALDCLSRSCRSGKCSSACDDGVKNGGETDVDCGGACGGCAVCLGCESDADCEPGLCQAGLCVPTIEIVSATYAANCGAPTPVPTIAAACAGKQTCNYSFNYAVDIGYDPAYGCYKALSIEYKCTGGTTTKSFYEDCAPCDPGNTPTQITLELECDPCLGPGLPPA